MPDRQAGVALTEGTQNPFNGGLADLVTEVGRVRDFGGVVEGTPLAVAEVRTVDQVRRIFEAARNQGVPVVTQGTAHSCGGQSLLNGGIVMRNRLEGPARWISETEIEAPSGATWRDVESTANSRGRAAPVVPSVLDISVGGTLSVGGYGTTSPRRGAQIDHVTGLELVSPDGQVRWCAPDANEELFRCTLAGVGQLGVITRVRLATTPETPDVSIYGYGCPSLSAMADSFSWMEDPRSWTPEYLRAFSYKPERPGILLYGAMGRRNGAEAIAGHESELEPARRRLGNPQTRMSTDNVRAVEDEFDNNWVERYPAHQRLWIDYGFSYPGFRAYCRELERLARAGEFGKAIRAVYISVIPRSPHGPDYFPFDIRPTGMERTFTCGTYCMVPVGDAEALKRVRRALRRCQERMLELGGRPYVYGFNQMQPVDWRGAFGGEAVDRLLQLKATHDPMGTIPAPWDRIAPEGEVAAEGSRKRFRPGSLPVGG